MTRLGRAFSGLYKRFVSVLVKASSSAWPTGFLSSKGKINVNGERAQGVPAYFRGINIIAEQMATLPVAVYREDENGAIYEATTNPINKLIKYRPHPLYDTVVFRETLIRNTLQYGESCFRVHYGEAGQAIEFELLPLPSDIKINEETREYFYEFEEAGRVNSKDIIHIKLYSKDGLRGQSPLKLLRDTFAAAINQTEYISAFYGNGAHVSGVLEVPTWLDEKQIESLKNGFNQDYAGPDNVGKTMIAQGGITYKERGSTPDKAQYASTKNLTTQDIANITGVHPILLGDVSKSTFQNTETVNRFFVQYVLRTFCKRFESEFNSKIFTGRNQGKLFLRFNLDGLLEGNTKDWAEKINVLMNHGIATRNEIRKMENLNPMPGGDDLFVSLNYTPLNKVYNDEEE